MKPRYHVSMCSL